MGICFLCVPKAMGYQTCIMFASDMQVARELLKGRSASLHIKERHPRRVSREWRVDNGQASDTAHRTQVSCGIQSHVYECSLYCSSNRRV